MLAVLAVVQTTAVAVVLVVTVQLLGLLLIVQQFTQSQLALAAQVVALVVHLLLLVFHQLVVELVAVYVVFLGKVAHLVVAAAVDQE